MQDVFYFPYDLLLCFAISINATNSNTSAGIEQTMKAVNCEERRTAVKTLCLYRGEGTHSVPFSCVWGGALGVVHIFAKVLIYPNRNNFLLLPLSRKSIFF